ncbi:peptidase [Paramyrothecium foliicola]|nr:peptidase [Paramyrothecium foliicola]
MMRGVHFIASLALASSAIAAERRSATKVEYIPNVYIVQLHDAATLGRGPDEHTHTSFTRRAVDANIDYNVRFEYKDPALFYGLSIEVPNNESVPALEALPEVVRLVPVRYIPRPAAPIELARETIDIAQGVASASQDSVADRKSNTKLNYNTPHSMTGVDRLHSAGIFGKGVKIAVLDTGVDYYHPNLGGGFGEGYKISFGYDLVGENYDGWSTPEPDDDPLATCVSGGHGTHVLGIIGADVPDDAPFFGGLKGVAPEATFGAYRVFGCSGGVGDDVLVAALIRAANDGADILNLSIGGFSTVGEGPTDPYHQVIQAITDKGIAVVVAAGNDGAVEPFSVNAPANSPSAIAVASIENRLFQTFELEDSNGDKILYSSVYPFPASSKELKLIALEGDYALARWGCRPEAYDGVRNITGSKEDYVILAKRGICPLNTIQAAAAGAGFRNVLTYPGDDETLDYSIQGYAAGLPTSDQNGVPLNLGVTVGRKLFEQVSKSKDYTVKFSNNTPRLTRQVWGGHPSNFSSVGPVWDFSLKPDIAAPGGQILSTWPLSGSGFAILSGTSMAAPYLAGALALLKSQLPDLSVPELVQRLQTTSKQVNRAPKNELAPPVLQGAGLVDAHDAIHYKSYVSPGKFQLGPTEKLAKSSPKIQIENPSDKAVEYTLSHVAAPGMARYPEWDAPDYLGYRWPSRLRLASLYDLAAKIEFPEGTKFTIPAGGKKEVAVKVVTPEGWPEHIVPIYNGFIKVATSNRETLSIPYLGAAYNYTAAPIFGSLPVPETDTYPDYPPLGAPQIFYQGRGIGNYVNASIIGFATVGSYLQFTSVTRFDIVHADIDFVPTIYGFDKDVPVNFTKSTAPISGTVAGVDIVGTNWIWSASAPWTNVISGWFAPAIWNATDYATPLPLPPGGYRILIQALRYGGNENNREEWDSWLSGVVENPVELPAEW